MSSRNDRFNKRMRALDVILASMRDQSKSKTLSDHGTGAELMYALLDLSPESVEAEERRVAEAIRDADTMFDISCALLILGGLGYLVPTLRLIRKNASDWEASVCEMGE